MKKDRIAAQLYSFRDFIKTPADVAETLRKLKKIGYDAVQLSSAIPPMPETELRRILDGEGFQAPTSHESAARIVNETAAVVDHLLALDCRHTAYPFPHELPTDAEATVRLARQLHETAEKMAAAGIALAYHNHAVEFTRFGDHTMLEIIYENAPALEAEIDTFWVHAGGGDPVDWIRRTAQRMAVIHLKDYGVNDNRNWRMMPLGQGNLNWPEILDAAEKSGVKWYVVEHDGDCADPFESFQISLDYLTGHFVR